MSQGTIKAGTYGQRYFRQQQAQITGEARGRERQIRAEIRKATKPKQRKPDHEFASGLGRDTGTSVFQGREILTGDVGLVNRARPHTVQARYRDELGQAVYNYPDALTPYGGARMDPPIEGNLGVQNLERARDIQQVVNTMPLVQDTRELQRIRDEIQAVREDVEEVQEEEEEEPATEAWDREARQDEEEEEVGADPAQEPQGLVEPEGDDDDDLVGLDIGEDVQLDLLGDDPRVAPQTFGDVSAGGDPVGDVSFEPEPEPEPIESWKPGDRDEDDSKWVGLLNDMGGRELEIGEGLARVRGATKKRKVYEGGRLTGEAMPTDVFGKEKDTDQPELTREEREAIAQGEGLGYEERLDFAGTGADAGQRDWSIIHGQRFREGESLGQEWSYPEALGRRDVGSIGQGDDVVAQALHWKRGKDISTARESGGEFEGGGLAPKPSETKMPLHHYKWKKATKKEGGGMKLDIGAKGAKPSKELIELQRGRVIDTRPGHEGKKIVEQAPSRLKVDYEDQPPVETPMMEMDWNTGEQRQIGSLLRHPKTRKVMRRMQEGDPVDPKDISSDPAKPTIYQQHGSGRFATGEEITIPTVYKSVGRKKPVRESWGFTGRTLDPSLQTPWQLREGTEGYRQIRGEESKLATKRSESAKQSERYRARARERDPDYRPSDLKGAYGGFNYGSGVDEWTTKEQGKSAVPGASYQGDLGTVGDPTPEEEKTGDMALSEEWDALAKQKVKKRGRGGGQVGFKETEEGFKPDFVPPGHYVGLRGRVRRDPNFPSAPDRPPVYIGGANVPIDPSQMQWTGDTQTEAQAEAELARLERSQAFWDAEPEPEPEPEWVGGTAQAEQDFEWSGFAPLQPGDFSSPVRQFNPMPPQHFNPNPTQTLAVEGDDSGFRPGTRYTTHRFNPIGSDGQAWADEQERRRQARTHQFHPSRDRRG